MNVSVAGCKIELFEPATYQSCLSNAAPWMKNIVKTYGGDPYQHLVDMAKLAQKGGLTKDLNLKADEVPLLAGVSAPTGQFYVAMSSVLR